MANQYKSTENGTSIAEVAIVSLLLTTSSCKLAVAALCCELLDKTVWFAFDLLRPALLTALGAPPMWMASNGFFDGSFLTAFSCAAPTRTATRQTSQMETFFLTFRTPDRSVVPLGKTFSLLIFFTRSLCAL